MRNENPQSTKTCPVCGQEWPEFLVEDPTNHQMLGCETCLIIKKDGVIQ